MGKITPKLTVRAQRKYAHKAYIPVLTKNDDPTEPEPVIIPQTPVFMNNRKPVNALLNDIAFQNIHVHPGDVERLRDVRVVLKRFVPEEQSVEQVAKKDKNPPNPILPEEIDEENKIEDPKSSSNTYSNQPDSSTTINNKKSDKKKATVKTKKNKPAKYEPPFLRSRAKSTPKVLNKAISKPNRSCIIRRISDCTEDNRPLTYFIKKRPIRTKKTNVAKKITTERILKKVKRTSGPTNRRTVRSGTSNSVKTAGAPQVTQNIAQTTALSREPELLSPSSEPEESITAEDVMKLVYDEDDNDDDILLDNNIARSESTNPLAEQDLSKSVSRVQEWFQKNTELQKKAQASSEFKVPHPPKRVSDPKQLPMSSTASGSTTHLSSPLQPQVLCCPTWNYQRLSSVVQNKSIIKDFCTICSRCKVIFIPELQSNMRPIELTQVGSSMDTSSAAARYPNNKIGRMLDRAAEKKDHVYHLKQIMTDKGRKILKAAILIRNKIDPNEKLSPEEHNILAQVIGILTKCNAGRVICRPAVPSLSYMTFSSVVDRGTCLQSVEETTAATRVEKPAVIPSPPKPTTPATPPTPAQIGKAPTFQPSPEEFMEGPIAFASQKRIENPNISLCGIKPPDCFKPPFKSGKVEINFKIFNQYIHRMLDRWGKATRRLAAIRFIQDPKIRRSPLFTGLELDLVKLFDTVQRENGIEACQNTPAKWEIVAKEMKLPCKRKSYTKLENVYLKYLLNYNSLTDEERKKTTSEVEKCWAQRDIRALIRAEEPLWRQKRMREGLPIDDDEIGSHLEQVCAEAEECVTPGRKTNVTNFKKLAEQVRMQIFPNDARLREEDVEREYWHILTKADSHVCVHTGSVDASEQDCGFPENVPPYDTHPWNLKLLRKSPENLLSFLGPSGTPSTCIHYGMMFSTSCWHMDPTSVPWIEYLHHGAPKIWYSISADQESKFRAAAKAICPFAVQNKDIWLSSDIIMIPPNVLRQYGIKVDRLVQNKGEYVIVYPNTYCSCVDTGFNISEGIYYAPHDWIMDVEKVFTNLRQSCEPSLFSLEKLLIALALDKNTPPAILQQAQAVLTSVLHKELYHRQGMVDRGIELMSPEVFLEQNQRASTSSWQIQPMGECAFCRCHLHLSKVIGVTEGQTSVCATHGLLLFDNAVSRREQLSRVYCIILIDNNVLYDILLTLKHRIMNSVDP